jgi:protein-L-isoaspartate(D-aspartate) O-methyltransferase
MGPLHSAMSDFEHKRLHMVRVQLDKRGIRDAGVLEAMSSVPRERFVSQELAESAYEDGPLPIGQGQTISQPYIVALTVEALQLLRTHRVLEVGTGSGYAAAVISLLAHEVHTIERVPQLAASAEERLARLGYHNVHVIHGDGSLGYPEAAPYDAIAVAAVGPRPPPALLEQLAIGGRLVMPVGPDGSQTLMRLTRTGSDAYEEESLANVRFVPLIGAQGFASDARPQRAGR